MSGIFGGLGPPLPLFRLAAADMQLTTDQALVRVQSFTRYLITDIVALRVSGATSVACLGGVYPAAAKAGPPLVAAAQSWLGLSGANKIVPAVLEAILGTDIQSATPILSLSTGSTAACVADLRVFGWVMD